MEIDLGFVGEFVNSRRFWGSLAIGLPIITIGLFTLYSMVSKIPFLKNIVQYIIMTFGLSIMLFVPVVFFSAFLQIEELKLALIFIIILLCVAVFCLFNQKSVVLFMKNIIKEKKFSA